MGWEEAPIVTNAAPWESDPIVRPVYTGPERRKQPRVAAGVVESAQAGFEGSATGLILRGKLPDVVLDPYHTKWYEKLSATVGQVVSELPEMIVGGAVGAAAGVPGGPITSLLTAGAGTFGVPTLIRESLMQAYEAGQANSSGEFLSRVEIVISRTAKDALVGALTVGAGKAAQTAAKTFGPVAAETAGLTAAAATMTVAPAALDGRLPEPEDFLNAAIMVAGGKAAQHVAGKIRAVYARTGVEPAQVVADAKRDPTIGDDLKAPLSDSEEMQTVYHGSGKFFEQFSSSKIGTGEGNAAFGAGLYFADSKMVADFYRKQLAKRPIPDDIKDVLNSLDDLGFESTKQALSAIRSEPNWKNLWNVPPEKAAIIENYLTVPFGELYEVQIPKSAIQDMIDWDKPFSEQPPVVQRAAEKLAYLRPREGENTMGDVIRRVRANAAPEMELLAQGVKGIKYLDGGSRSLGTGTYNYVVFDDSLVSITGRTNDIPRAYQKLAAEQTARDAVPMEKAAQVKESPFAPLPDQSADVKSTDINFRYINASEDAMATMARLSQVYEAEIQTQRTGTQTWQVQRVETQKFLESLASDPAAAREFLNRVPGTPAGWREIRARAEITVQATEELGRLSREYAAKEGNVTPTETLEYMAAIERTGMIHATFLGARSEPGRAMNALKDTKRAAEHARLAREIMETYKADPLTMSKMLSQIDTVEGTLRFARDVQKATTWEKVVEAWKAGLISGPITHLANVMGNTTVAAVRVPVDTLAAVISKARGRAPGEGVAMAEPLARVIGLLHGTLDGLKVGAGVLKTGEYRVQEKGDQFRKAIEGTKGEVIRLPFRALAAEDAVFRTMNERAEAYSLAIREAVKEGHNPVTREFRERVIDLSHHPTPEMQAAIDQVGARFTFNLPLGEKGQRAQQLIRAWHLEWAVPFVQTPGNILKELTRMTPAAPFIAEWRADLAKGGAAADKAYAEIALGSAVSAAVAQLTFMGLISGAGDPDPSKARVQRAAGWQPYSGKIGDTWYSYARLQPIGTLIGLSSDMAEVWEHMTLQERDRIPKMIAVAFANAVTHQTFLQGVTNIVNATSDPKRFGPAFIEGLAGSLVPGVVAQLTQMTDPFVREVDGALEAIRNRIPGARQQLFPKRDPFGEPVASTDRLAGVLPITKSVESTDPVRLEAARLGVAVAKIRDTVSLPAAGDRQLGKVSLTSAERDVFATVAGHFAYQVLQPIVRGDSWASTPDFIKKRIFEEVFQRAHRVGAVEALSPERRQTEIDRIVREVESRLTP